MNQKYCEIQSQSTVILLFVQDLIHCIQCVLQSQRLPTQTDVEVRTKSKVCDTLVYSSFCRLLFDVRLVSADSSFIDTPTCCGGGDGGGGDCGGGGGGRWW